MFLPKQAMYFILIAAALIAEPVYAGQDEAITALDSLTKIKSDQKLTAWIETADGNVATHHLGDELRLNLQSNQDGYIYVLRVDSNGVGWLTVPRFDEDNLMRANEPVIYPNFGEKGNLIARLPLGPITTYIVSAMQPLDVGANAGSEIEIGSAKANFDDIKGKFLKSSDPSKLAVIKLEHQVKARKGESQFSAADIVSYFTTTTRAIQRPTISADIRFEFDSAKLTPEAKKNLDEWGAALSNPLLKDNKFQVAGHTDDVGSADYNMKLSWNRAAAVKEYLTKKFQISQDRLVTDAHGESAPIMAGTSEEVRAANRRVEFVMPRN